MAALFSGAALLTHILVGVSLGIALAFGASMLVAAVCLVWWKAPVQERVRLVRFARIGIVAGVTATIAYDTSKFLLSRWDPSPYNPFEALRTFGVLLVGSTAPEAAVFGAGTAFHLLNGVAFGVAFCFLFGQRGILAGVTWGVFLELFQLTLYPGWLDIRFYAEFAQISALSHIVYGGVLGASTRFGLTRQKPGESTTIDAGHRRIPKEV